MPATRRNDPASSKLAEQRAASATLEQAKRFRETILAIATNLTIVNDTRDFIDDELVADVLKYGRAVYGVEWKDSSVRRVRKDLSEEAKAEIVLTGGMRRDCRCWKWQPYREPVEVVEVKVQKGLFDE